jgi:hypothetical protein
MDTMDVISSLLLIIRFLDLFQLIQFIDIDKYKKLIHINILDDNNSLTRNN